MDGPLTNHQKLCYVLVGTRMHVGGLRACDSHTMKKKNEKKEAIASRLRICIGHIGM